MSRHRATLLMLLLSFTILSFSSQAWGQPVPLLELVDESGAVTSTYVEGSRVFARVVDVLANVSPGPDSIQARLAASRSGDVEFLTLTETNAGVFRGSIPLAPGSASQPGVLETAADPNPPHDRDTVELSYNGGSATVTASIVGSLTWFLDDDGRVRQSFAVGERVHVRVADSLRNDPATLTSFFITVASPATGDQEEIYVQETGFDTGIFEGSVATGYGGASSNDGVLGTSPGQGIEAVHVDFDLPTSSRADATMAASRVDLVDAQGRPAEYYLESSRVYVQVLDNVSGSPGFPDTVQVTLQADLSGDQELVTLTETGPTTGIYRGSMELRRGPGFPGNGTLETYYEGPPYHFDTVRATSGTSTDAVGTIGSLTSFVDAYGNEVESYPEGVTIRVRVEDHNFNDPARRDAVGVTVTSLGTGDAEGLTLLEVAKDSGIFEGSLATQLHAPAIPNDGYFPVQAGHEIEAMHVDANGYLASGDRARIESASVAFVDEAGRPTAELLENGTARIRVISAYANGNPSQADGLLVELRSRFTGDQEVLPLAETGPSTGIFEGTIQLSYSFSSQPGNSLLETSNPPPYTGDQVTALYEQYSVTARTVGARVVFLDGFGRETTTFPIGQPVRVRVTDPSRNNPTSRDTGYISLSACESSDQESLPLTETGFNTGVFEGQIPSRAQSPSSNDGTLQVVELCVIRAFYQNPNNANGVEATARFTVGEVLFVDAQGRPASVFLEGTRAYLRVVDYSRVGTVQVNVTADLSGDAELVTLQETGPGSSVFLGSIELRSSPSGSPQNGILETSQASGPPHEFETLRAVYPSLSGDATATASTLSFRVWFVDSYGAVTTTYTQGTRVYVRLEDHNFNDPARFDVRPVTVRTSRGDEEAMQLLETGKATGIFEGSIELDGANPPSFNDGRLQAGAGDELDARIDGLFNDSPAKARVEFVSLSFIDEAGRPTVELLENGRARVRVVNPDNNGNPSQVDGTVVRVRAFHTGDQEDLPLAETGPNTGVFEGEMRLSFNFSASQGNGLLETANQGPEYLGEQVTAIYGPFSATARTRGARVVFVDGFGRETMTFPLGSPVRVRVTDPTRNTPASRDAGYITLLACQSDQESFPLTETGFNTAVFEGEIPSAAQSVTFNDGTLQGVESCVIRAFYSNPNSPTTTEATATFMGGEVLFVDVQGSPASVFLEGTRAYLRVVDHGRSGMVPVEVTAELSGDREQVTLQETRPGSGIFAGSIELRSAPQGSLQNGILETSQASGPPHEFETLRAVYQEPSGDSTATASTLSFRVWFVDSYGAVTTTYTQGSRVYVRLEDHNFNDPARFDPHPVTVRTSRGDEEAMQLLETGKATGIFEGSIELDGANPPSFNDGRLQAGAGDELDARIDGLFNASLVKARVEHAAISFIDEAGRPTVELLENGRARVRVTSPDNNGNPSQVDGTVVRVRAFHTGDQEDLPLAETGPNTGVFEGSLQLSFSFSVFPGNGTLETANQGPEYLGEQVTASYGPFSATARTRGARVVFIDGFGRETTTFPLGSPVRVRVTDPTRNMPSNRDTGYIALTACQSDQESFPLTETGFNTAVFEGEVPSAAQSVTFNDGTLQGVESCLIRAFYSNPNSPTTTEATATFTGGEVLFVDAQGQPASVFLEGTRAYLRVVDHGRSGTVPVEVTAELSRDREQVTLSEVTPGVFAGSIELASSPQGFLQNGILETAQVSGPPHEYDTLRAVYQEPSGDSTATATTLAYRVWFVDASGAVVSSYVQGSRVYVRLEDHNFNRPTEIDRLYLDLRSSRGDFESIEVTETGGFTGIYEGSILLANTAAIPSDGTLQAGPGDEITVDRNGPFVSAPVSARIEHAAISFIDGAGAPAVELLENGAVRVRVISPDHAGNPSLQVQLKSFLTGDQENLFLTATGPDTGVFEGSINLSFNVSASEGNGVLETGNQGPEHLGDQVTAIFGPVSATARTVGSRVVFLSLRGQPTASYSLGATVRVRIEDPSRNSSAAVDTFGARVRSLSNGDEEFVTMTETSPVSGIFEGSVPSTASAGSPGDGVLSAGAGDVVEVENANANRPTFTTARASFLANHAPQAVDDVAETIEDQPVIVSLIFNDVDPESGPLTISSFTQGTKGTVSLELPGTVRYTPHAGETGQDTFTYFVMDAEGAEAVATVTITITPANRPPVANDDTASVAEDGTVNIAVLANDTDPEGNPLTIVIVTQGTNGVVSINPGQTVAYTPAVNYSGTDSFTYAISDGNSGGGSATVTVTITATNDAPVANADTASGDEDNPVTVAVLANDTDAEGNTLTVTGTNHQGAVVNADNTVTFRAGPNNFGVYTVDYTVSDGQGGTATGTVTFTVNEVNDPPVAAADVETADEDELAIVHVLSNDSDVENNTLTVTSITQPTNGTATLRPNGTVEYRSNTNYNGPDSFTYTVTDSRGASATATVSVTVRPRNDVPVANPDTASVAEDGSVDIPVLANDTDLDSDTLGLSTTSQGAHGTASPQPDGTIRYTPEANFHGTDTFTYRATDNRGGTTPATTVTVTVTPVNDAPVANADTASVAEDGTVDVAVLSNDTDADNDTLTVTAVTQGTNGAVSINPDKTVKYTPSANFHGTDSYTYTVSDGNGGTATAAVTVMVAPVNDAPVAVNDTATVAAGSAVTVSVLGNDADVDGPALSVTAVTQGANGSVAINPNQTVTYTAGLFVGTDSFTYTVSDGAGGTATATVTVTVTAPSRVTTDLQVRYDFNEGSGSTVSDTSEVGTPLNLTISPTSAVSWQPGALSINSATVISSAGAAIKVINAVRSSNAITVEAWVAADNLTQTGPARIVSINKNTSQANIVFGQSASRYETQTSTSAGTRTQQTPLNSASLSLKHVVSTRNSSGLTVMYIDGVQVASATTTGSLSNWDTTMRLALANTVGGGRPWVGDLHLVAIYSRSLTSTEVQRNFLAGANGN